MPTKEEIRKSEEARGAYQMLVKLFQPTTVSVLSLGSETSKAMREENRQRHLEALRKRASK